MAKSVAEILVSALVENGVRHVFGVVGDALNDFTEAIRKSDRLQWIGVRHEEGAALAASGQAKLTGRLGVCAGTTGPGGNHLVAGLYEATRDHAPVLAISGAQPAALRGMDFIQTADHQRLFADVATYSAAVDSPDSAAHMIHAAIAHAYAGPGVAHLVIPQDTMGMTSRIGLMSGTLLRPTPEVAPDPNDIERAARLIDGHAKITLMVGQGARGAEAEVLALAEHLVAPVVHTFRAKDLFAYEHPLVIGGIGLIGGRAGTDAVAGADLLVMIGTDYPYSEFLPTDKTIIQIDTRAVALGRRAPVELGIVGSARPALAELLSHVAAKTDRGWLERGIAARSRWDAMLDEKCALERDTDLIHPQAVARLASDLAAHDAVFVVDTGNVTLWSGNWIRQTGRQRIVASFNNAAVGTALGQANGIQALDVERQVIALCGDGGFTMLMGEFMTAVEHHLPVKVVVFNNGTWGMVHLEMEAAGDPVFQGANFPNCDFAAFARACGAAGFTVRSPGALRAALQEAFTTRGPAIVDVVVNPAELPVMPHLNLAQALRFGMAKVKEALG